MDRSFEAAGGASNGVIPEDVESVASADKCESWDTGHVELEQIFLNKLVLIRRNMNRLQKISTTVLTLGRGTVRLMATIFGLRREMVKQFNFAGFALGSPRLDMHI